MYRYYVYVCLVLLLRTAAIVTCQRVTVPCCRDAIELAACRSLNASGIPLPRPCLSILSVSSVTIPVNSSCQEIHSNFPSAPSGNYQIQLPDGTIVEVYCDMEGSNCGGEGGWTRVGYFDMTEPGATCPQGLTQKVSSLILCGNTITEGCESTIFPTLGLNYQQICGRLRGYQFGSLEAFGQYISTPSITIDGRYLDGVSITYGSAPRKHIWTYTCGRSSTDTNLFGCPCNDGSTVQSPPFIGSDYYCESAAACTASCSTIFYPSDPLWDGQQCPGQESPCCTNSNLPWFNKTLVTTTNEDIELRLCRSQDSEEVLLDLIELFVR